MKVIIKFFIFTVFSTCAFGENGNWEYKDWTVTTNDSFVRYVTHGTGVYGHQFGFIKMDSNCNRELLWVSWSVAGDSMESKLKKYEGTTDVQLDVKVGGTQFQLEVPFLKAKSLTSFTTMTAFSNYAVNSNMVNLLKKSNRIDITITAPKGLLKHYDMPFDYFSLNGFTAARLKAQEYCEALNEDKELAKPSPIVKPKENTKVVGLTAKMVRRDAEFKEDVVKLCSKSELCELYEGYCSKTQYRNICMYNSLYRSLLLMTLCVDRGAQECMAEQGEYEGRLSAFMSSQDVGGTSPKSGMARMAMNKCEPFHIIPVPSGLTYMEEKLKSVDPMLTRQFDNKSYFECVKEQYLK